MKNYTQFLTESSFSIDSAIKSFVQNFDFGAVSGTMYGSKPGGKGDFTHSYSYTRTTITHSKSGFKITIQTDGYSGTGIGSTVEEAWKKATLSIKNNRDEFLKNRKKD